MTETKARANEERDDEATAGEQLPTLSAADLTPAEAARMRAVLRTYFPELDGDDDMSGADTVDALARLCGTLDKLGDHDAVETAGKE